MSEVVSLEEAGWIFPKMGGHVRAMVSSAYHPEGQSDGPWAALNLGDHVGDEEAAVSANRALFARELGCEKLKWLRQVHGNRCVEVEANGWRTRDEADGIVTREAGVGLVIQTADCVPVLLAARSARVIGACHAGWQGLVSGVIANTVSAMTAGTEHCELSAFIGPCISSRRYEVGEDVWRHFVGESGALEAHEDPQKRYLNLHKVAQNQLLSAGVAQIEVSGVCTFESQNFYSHRGRGTAPNVGRFASAITLKD